MGGDHWQRFDEEKLSVLASIVEEHPDATQEELVTLFMEKTGHFTSPSSISRALKKAGITRKKNVLCI